MTCEKISVIVSIYNAKDCLKRCIESIKVQTYTNIEIILVNDGSTDSSLDICKEYELIDTRIIVVNKENGGLTSARKAGFEVSRGKYVTFLDSDDYLEPNYIERLYESIKVNNSDVSICNYILENGSFSKSIKVVHSKNVFTKDEFLENLILPCVFPMYLDDTIIPNFLWLRLFDRNVITDNCFVSERKVYTEDLFFNLGVYDNCHRVSIIDDCLYHYIVNSSSLTHIYRDNKCEMEIQRIKYIEKMLNQMSIDDKDRLSMVVIRSIWECVENAMRAGTYSKFVKNIKPFFSDLYMRNLKINPKLKQVTVSEKICYICFKYKLIFFVYLYKKAVAMIKK